MYNVLRLSTYEGIYFPLRMDIICNDIIKISVYIYMDFCFRLIDWYMVFNATFNSISVISWRSVLLVEKTRVPEENY
jgi:hypothetical protein